MFDRVDNGNTAAQNSSAYLEEYSPAMAAYDTLEELRHLK